MRQSDSPIAKMIRSQATEVIDNLQAALRESKPRLSEREFVGRYLPILTARNLKDKDGNVVPVDMGHWFAVAGNAFTPVDIVDDNGQVLFEVPPINRTGETLVPRNKELTMTGISKVGATLMEDNPRGSVNYYANQYFARYGHHRFEADLEAWLAILKRYNMVDHYLGNHDAQPTITEDNVSGGSAFDPSQGEWDDF